MRIFRFTVEFFHHSRVGAKRPQEPRIEFGWLICLDQPERRFVRIELDLQTLDQQRVPRWRTAVWRPGEDSVAHNQVEALTFSLERAVNVLQPLEEP